MPETDETNSTLIFFVNGKKVVEPCVDPEWTLLYYLRNILRLTGTKLGCGEGGCGACTVMISKYNHTSDSLRHYSVNACLTPVASVHGQAVTTVEGIGSTKTRLHVVQERIAKAHGSQCGFCTPGMVMSMYTLLRNNPLPSMAQVEEYFAGNLCRCTGYRPIIDGVRGLTFDGQKGGCGKLDCCKLRNSIQHGATNGVSVDVMNGTSSKDEPSTTYEETDISHALHVESEFRIYDPSQEVIFPPELKVHQELHTQFLVFKGPRVTYYRPSSLKQLLDLKAVHDDAKIIVGNTEVGVEVRFKNQLYPVLINSTKVSEITSVTMKDSGIEFGASCTLTSIEEILQDVVKNHPDHRTRVFTAILEMLKWFSGKQIRNCAAIGGNIMTGSPISDLNPLLMAAEATLTLCSKERGERQVVMNHRFFTGYRKNIVLPDEILLSVHIPYTQEDEYLYGYKQARRRDDDIAIVNAGMRVIFEAKSTVVKRIVLAFGGMAPTTVMALNTMKELIGKQWNSSLLETGTSLILKDLPLPPSAPGGMIEYRRALSVSFFFKFYMTVRGGLNQRFPDLVDPLTEEEQRAIQVHEYRPPKSSLLYQKVPSGQTSLDPIGRPMTHTSALKQATGEAIYVDDMPHFENELYAGFVYSNRAHAKIISIDETDALLMDGVEGFFCARDLPGERNKIGVEIHDEEIFASEKVICVGQLIGMVVAKNKPLAKRAAKQVKVQYEDIKPLIITTQDAIREKSYYGQWTIHKGDAELALQNSPHILEGEIHLGGQEHFYMETSSHLAVPKGESGEMEIFSTTQHPSLTQNFVAKALDVPANRIICRVKRIGGGFGGKTSRVLGVSIPLCVAASVLNRPVRKMLDRDEDMQMTGGRHPFLGRWRVGFTREGFITSLQVDLYANGGCTLDLTAAVVEKAMFAVDNVYKCENVLVKGFACRTNLPSNTAFRGFGVPQGTYICEDIITRLSAFLKMDTNVVREKNMYMTGDKTHYNQIIERCTVRRCWDEVLEQADYTSRKSAADKFNKENKYRKRGLSAVPIKYGIGFTKAVLNQAGALVHVYTDGSVLLTHGGTEMGQGLHTKMIQVASRVLKIPVDRIHISETSSDTVPNTSPSAASASSDINGMAVLNACEILLQRLEPIIAKNPKGSWEDWIKDAYINRISLSAAGFHKTPDMMTFDFDTQTGRPFNYYSFGAAVTEVEIDCLTGDHSLLRTDIVMDVGESLNPAVDIGQIEGAFIQGVGLLTLEELCYSPEGVLLTRGPSTYKIPGFQDIPREFNVSLLRGAPNPRAVFSSKAVGEPPLLLAASAFYAIKEAIAAVRKEAGLSPVFRLDTPATAERIRMACEDFLTEKIESSEPGSFVPWCVKV
ncbi:hypothetical protein SK128_021569 [Halocaridina rubra]|uniref:xanthine dehydrogenase n=1 Tax=Halocaridina rubra TaxID=373956 RepID=A0AAN8WFU0_HALRR